jgi:sporulation protein YlmC with PRC-barrel domain
MEEIKHKSLPIDKTVDIKDVVGKKVLTNDGKKIGKVKSVHLHPSDLTIEGIKVDPGWFEADHYVGENYIEKMTDDAVILNMTPVTEYLGMEVHDSDGKKVGTVKAVNRSKKTNKLMSIVVKQDEGEEDFHVSSDYISAIGHSVMLKENLEEIEKK